MAYSDDIAALGADHHWDFDGDSLDQIGSVNGTDTSILYTSAAIALDATNCMETNATGDRVALATTTDINNSAQARKAVAGWFSTTAIQPPPKRIYGEGNNTTCFQFVMGFGNYMMFECTEPTNFATGLQVFGPAAVPDRVYHLCGIFSGSAYDNEVKFFVDGIEMTDADPVNRQPGTASLDARGVPEFADPAGTVGVGGNIVILNASINGKYNHWVSWGDEADALLTDSEVRVTLFERGAKATSTLSTGTESVMQTALDALGPSRSNECLGVDINVVSGGGDFILTSDQVFDDLTSMHFRYNGTADTLTLVNVSGGNATAAKSGAPYGGTLVIATRQTLTVTVLNASTKAVVVGARVYIEADTGGDLTAGTEIMNTTTNGSGIATAIFDYTNSQPIIGRVRKGSASTYYKTAPIPGPLTSAPLNATILVVEDE